nr:TatD family hydrolase [bacterium]
MISLFDTHCHLDDARFDEDREQVIAELAQNGVGAVLVPGCTLEGSRRARDIAGAHPGIVFGAGIHPHDADDQQPGYLDGLAALLGEDKCVILGEIGLDYHYDFAPREAQKRVLAEQLALAADMKKPVSLHVREAYGDAMELLHRYMPSIPGGVMHCYSGSLEVAQECMALGLSISFAGSITFKNAPRIRKVAENIPLERLWVETDGPYLAPEPLRGSRNQPKNVRLVAACLAQLHGISLEDMADIARRNANAVLGLPCNFGLIDV